MTDGAFGVITIERAGTAMILIVVLPVCPPPEADIRASPGTRPRTTPLVETDAMAVSLELHVTGYAEMVEPVSPSAVAMARVESPVRIVEGEAVTTIVLTVGRPVMLSLSHDSATEINDRLRYRRSISRTCRKERACNWRIGSERLRKTRFSPLGTWCRNPWGVRVPLSH